MTSRWVLLAVLGVSILGLVIVSVRRVTGRLTGPVPRLVVGLLATVGAIVSGGVLVGVDSETPPEQMGMSVVVDGAHVSPERGFDGGLFVTADVTVAHCGDPVSVRYTVSPTAEFWIDNRDLLHDDGTVTFGVPSDGLRDVAVFAGTEASVPLPRSSVSVRQAAVADVEVTTPEDDLTVIVAHVPRLGKTLTPLTLTFQAEWTRSRSILGGCYLQLPALTGLPTAMTGARVQGTAAPTGTPLDDDQSGSFFEISSEAAGQHAGYNPDLEVNHGVTVLRLGDYTVDGSLSAPAPTSNLQGLPTWNCSSSNVPPVGYINYTDSGDPATDYMVKLNGAGGVFSTARIEAQLDQPSCGSLVALDDPSFGTRRDLLLLLIGALFSFGVEVMLSANERRAKERPSEQ